MGPELEMLGKVLGKLHRPTDTTDKAALLLVKLCECGPCGIGPALLWMTN